MDRKQTEIEIIVITKDSGGADVRMMDVVAAKGLMRRFLSAPSAHDSTRQPVTVCLCPLPFSTHAITHSPTHSLPPYLTEYVFYLLTHSPTHLY